MKFAGITSLPGIPAIGRYPASFEDAVAFDAAIRHDHPGATARGTGLHGTAYLHRDRIPLDQVDLGIDTGPEPDGCSPWACRGSDEEDTGTDGGER